MPTLICHLLENKLWQITQTGKRKKSTHPTLEIETIEEKKRAKVRSSGTMGLSMMDNGSPTNAQVTVFTLELMDPNTLDNGTWI